MRVAMDEVSFECGRTEVHMRKAATRQPRMERDAPRKYFPSVRQTEPNTAPLCRQANESIRQTKEVDVLKITRTETSAEEKWILQGRLVGPWVRELRTSWRKTHRTENGRNCVVDLNDVTFTDKGGERLLRAMSRQGVQFVAGSIYIRHVLEQLKTNRKGRLSRFIARLFAGFVATVVSFSPSRQANLGKVNGPQDTATRRNASYWSHGGPESSTIRNR